jgi:hypothetical protein
LSISNFEFRSAARPRAAAPRRRLARALLFFALSAAAVPACQYYEGDGAKQQEARAVTDGRVRT